MPISPRTICAHLRKIDQVDLMTGALYRELAQEILAQPEISLARRQVIADRLNRANSRLGRQITASEDSY